MLPPTAKPAADDALLLEQLRAHLLREDRAATRRLEDLVEDPARLFEKIAPEIEPRLAFLRENFPTAYRSVVDKLIQERIQNSQEQIVEVIYPVLGSMVRKYIEHQFQLLKESIEQRLDEMRARLNFWQRLRARMAGISETELLIAAANAPSVEEIYLVEHNSGLLLAHAARHTNLDREAVAGMLTAIKAFVEDAFRREREELDYISYDHYKIVVQNYRACYIAALIEGSVSARERSVLSQKIETFILKEIGQLRLNAADETQSSHLSARLRAWFIQP